MAHTHKIYNDWGKQFNRLKLMEELFLDTAILRMNFGGDQTGDIYYRDASGNTVALHPGANGKVLKITNGIPSWQDDTGGITEEQDPLAVKLAGSYANPTWLASLAWSKITGAPAFLTSETDPIWTAEKPNYYTKTELQTSSSAQVHSGNITNVPSAWTNNFANTDLTLTANRTHDLANNTLSLINAGAYLVRGLNGSNDLRFALTPYSSSWVAYSATENHKIIVEANLISIERQLAGDTIAFHDLNLRLKKLPSVTVTADKRMMVYDTATHKVEYAPVPTGFSGAWTDVTGKPNSGEFIYNQIAAAQTADYYISGQGRANTFFANTYILADTYAAAAQIAFGGVAGTNRIQANVLGDGVAILNTANDYGALIAGKILVNTVTDAGYRLDVNGTGRFTGAVTFTNAHDNHHWGLYNMQSNWWSGLGFAIYDVTNNDARLFIKPNGNVGIGTVDPNYRLDVTGTARISNMPNDTAPTVFMVTNGLGEVKYSTVSQMQTALGISGTNFVQNQYSTGQAADFMITGTGAWRSAVRDRRLMIFAHAAYGTGIQSANEANDSARTLFLNAEGGNVVIGSTTDTSYRLDVTGTTRVTSYLTNDILANDGAKMIIADAAGTLTKYANVWASGNTLYFNAGAVAGASTDVKLVIGRATASTYMLDVNGTARFAEEVRITNTAYPTLRLVSNSASGGAGYITSHNSDLTAADLILSRGGVYDDIRLKGSGVISFSPAGAADFVKMDALGGYTEIGTDTDFSFSGYNWSNTKLRVHGEIVSSALRIGYGAAQSGFSLAVNGPIRVGSYNFTNDLQGYTSLQQVPADGDDQDKILVHGSDSIIRYRTKAQLGIGAGGSIAAPSGEIIYGTGTGYTSNAAFSTYTGVSTPSRLTVDGYVHVGSLGSNPGLTWGTRALTVLHADGGHLYVGLATTGMYWHLTRNPQTGAGRLVDVSADGTSRTTLYANSNGNIGIGKDLYTIGDNGYAVQLGGSLHTPNDLIAAGSVSGGYAWFGGVGDSYGATILNVTGSNSNNIIFRVRGDHSIHFSEGGTYGMSTGYQGVGNGNPFRYLYAPSGLHLNPWGGRVVIGYADAPPAANQGYLFDVAGNSRFTGSQHVFGSTTALGWMSEFAGYNMQIIGSMSGEQAIVGMHIQNRAADTGNAGISFGAGSTDAARGYIYQQQSTDTFYVLGPHLRIGSTWNGNTHIYSGFLNANIATFNGTNGNTTLHYNLTVEGGNYYGNTTGQYVQLHNSTGARIGHETIYLHLDGTGAAFSTQVRVGNLSSAPASWQSLLGTIYYNTTLNRFMGVVDANNTWKKFLMEGDVTGTATSAPAGEIVYGTGTGVTSNAAFSWDSNYLKLSASGAAGMILKNGAAGGHEYWVFSSQSSYDVGNGAFGIIDVTAGAYRFAILPTGSILLGDTAAIGDERLLVNGNTRVKGGGVGIYAAEGNGYALYAPDGNNYLQISRDTNGPYLQSYQALPLYLNRLGNAVYVGGGTNTDMLGIQSSSGGLRLALVATATTAYIRATEDLDIGSGGNNSRMIVKANGNVLIGTTTNSTYKLDVVGYVRTSESFITADMGIHGSIENGGRSLIVTPRAFHVNYTEGFWLSDSALTAYTFVINQLGNTMLGFTSNIGNYKLQVNGHTFINQTAYVGATGFHFDGTTRWVNSADGSNGLKWTRPGVIDAMYLTGGGNLILGSTENNVYSFDRLLQIDGATNAKIDVNTGALKGSMFVIQMGYLGATDAGLYVGTHSNHNLYFYTNHSVKATITAAGNMLIGTTAALNSSTATLQVQHGAYFFSAANSNITPLTVTHLNAFNTVDGVAAFYNEYGHFKIGSYGLDLKQNATTLPLYMGLTRSATDYAATVVFATAGGQTQSNPGYYLGLNPYYGIGGSSDFSLWSYNTTDGYRQLFGVRTDRTFYVSKVLTVDSTFDGYGTAGAIQNHPSGLNYGGCFINIERPLLGGDYANGIGLRINREYAGGSGVQTTVYGIYNRNTWNKDWAALGGGSLTGMYNEVEAIDHDIYAYYAKAVNTKSGAHLRTAYSFYGEAGNMYNNGWIKTANPAGVNSAGEWKLGKVIAASGVVTDQDAYVVVEIDGVQYKLALAVLG